MKEEREMSERLRDLIHRHRKRYIRDNSRPCGKNCNFMTQDGSCSEFGVVSDAQCHTCQTFSPFLTRSEMEENFREDIKHPKKLLREYRDVAILMWCLGYLDEEDISTEGKIALDLGCRDRGSFFVSHTMTNPNMTNLS